MVRRFTFLGLLIVGVAGVWPISAETKKGEDKKDSPDSKEIAPVVTSHSIRINGDRVPYKATAGFVYLKDFSGTAKKDGDKDASDEPKPKAKVFFIAYTRSDVSDPEKRPVTFTFNGGPGSASIWLHMGGLGPRIAKLTDEGEAPAPPYELVDNESSWLDKTDLVFIDPVSTGYSRTVSGEDAKQFHGLKEDIESVGEFIRLYLTKNARWSSPKFIAGESYGTTRAAGLTEFLQNRYGIYLNGVILVSSVLNYKSLIFVPDNDNPYVDYLPSYSTSAWYHKKLPTDLQQKSVTEVAKLSRAFAANEYRQALARGDQITPVEKETTAAQLARFTGLPKSYVLQLGLRVPDSLFFSQLLRDENKAIGRYDSRYTGLRYQPGTDNTEYDPSDEAVFGPFTSTFNDYVRRELKYESDYPYEGVAEVEPWNFGNAVEGFPNTAADLAKAMTRNPYLKVWVTCSYYDLATPFFGAENTVSQMLLDPTVRRNLRFTYYESGHMLYIHKPSRLQFKQDFAAFLKEATNQKPVPTAAR